MDITIESRAGPASFRCGPNEAILYAGLSQGLALPYDCATGTCGICKARVKSGSVETIWAAAPALSKLQLDRGDILMCQSRATSDCVLRVPASVTTLPDGAAPRHRAAILGPLVRLTHDVARFDVTLPEPVSFASGQFMVLTVPGIVGGRAYSMVNHAVATDRLELVIKRKPGGTLSDWMFERERAPTPASMFGPLGRATFRPGQDRDMVCIAGGSGIAGMLAILEEASACGHFDRHRGQLFFGVRTLADGFYLDRLAQYVLASKGGALDVVIALSHEPGEARYHPAFPSLRLARGFVHDVAASELKLAAEGLAAFVAGPPPMVDGAIRVLIGHGVSAATIRYDKFG